MKSPGGLFIVVAALLLFGGVLHAQQQQDPAETLREQIRNLEVIDNDPATQPAVRELNRSFLATRREQLQALLRKRIDSLREYLTTVKGVLTTEEIERTERSISQLEKELESLKNSGKTPPLAAATVRVVPVWTP